MSKDKTKRIEEAIEEETGKDPLRTTWGKNGVPPLPVVPVLIFVTDEREACDCPGCQYMRRNTGHA